MMVEANETIEVESTALTPNEIREITDKVNKMHKEGYSTITILYALSKKYGTKGCYNENNQFVITLS